jgi:hypothetical protein
MGSQGFVSCGGEGSKACFDNGKGGIGDDGGKGMGIISHHEIERGFAGYGVRAVIVGKFGVRDHFCP